VVLRQISDTSELEYVHARLFNTYGPFESESRIVPYLIRRLGAGLEAELTAGTQVRDFIFVEDVARALVVLGGCPLASRAATFNVCTGRGTSVREIAALVADAMGASPALLRLGARPDRTDEPPSIVGSPDALRAAAGWTATVRPAEGVARMVAAA
jgi:dTDP-glucose 4,6-dehydratase